MKKIFYCLLFVSSLKNLNLVASHDEGRKLISTGSVGSASSAEYIALEIKTDCQEEQAGSSQQRAPCSRDGAVKKWIKIHGSSLTATGTVAAIMRTLLKSNDDGYYPAFAQHAFADSITDSIQYQWNESESPYSIKNLSFFTGKIALLYLSGVLVSNLDDLLLKTTGLNTGWEFAFILSAFYLTGKHFLNKRQEKDEEFIKQLIRTISDPKLVAEAINDPELNQLLEDKKKDPNAYRKFEDEFRQIVKKEFARNYNQLALHAQGYEEIEQTSNIILRTSAAPVLPQSERTDENNNEE